MASIVWNWGIVKSSLSGSVTSSHGKRLINAIYIVMHGITFVICNMVLGPGREWPLVLGYSEGSSGLRETS